MAHAEYRDGKLIAVYKFPQDGIVTKEISNDSKEYKDFRYGTTKENARKEAKEIRDEALVSCTVELNGNIYQARECDKPRMEVLISELEKGQKYKWIMENDVPTLVSKEELETVLALGIVEVKKIWATYIEALEAL